MLAPLLQLIPLARNRSGSALRTCQALPPQWWAHRRVPVCRQLIVVTGLRRRHTSHKWRIACLPARRAPADASWPEMARRDNLDQGRLQSLAHRDWPAIDTHITISAGSSSKRCNSSMATTWASSAWARMSFMVATVIASSRLRYGSPPALRHSAYPYAV